MSIIKYLDRIKVMDDYIHRRATGSPDEFANKIGISRIALLKYIRLLKEMNAPIKYDPLSITYYYLFPCQLKMGYEFKKIPDTELIEMSAKNLKNFCEIIEV